MLQRSPHLQVKMLGVLLLAPPQESESLQLNLRILGVFSNPNPTMPSNHVPQCHSSGSPPGTVTTTTSLSSHTSAAHSPHAKLVGFRQSFLAESAARSASCPNFLLSRPCSGGGLQESTQPTAATLAAYPTPTHLCWGCTHQEHQEES